MTDLRPVVTASSEAAELPFLATTHRVLVPAAATGGALSALDAGIVPTGFAPPLHQHLSEHELFIVASGAVRFVAGDVTQVVEGSGMAFLPAREAHSFQVLHDAQMYVLTVPSGLALAGNYERFVMAVSALSGAAAPTDEELFGRLATLGAQHDIPIVGPPPQMQESA
ncbi:hypothetical protein C8D87_11469 [Lentzea atacamensis]|uniref:AraC-type arabinose-binding/dimerisation domain-containing protein n=1 Tax=Lentzea atacamensis TaxID=531938 RepID=A0ABX9DWC3_9PSEU|nr:AraC family ligand binding domain-containing protein [Lentzea atacamensis]RAS59457.1 hypothetical protein C8D87_11469 [Lentzea atacamensis]